MPRKLAWKRCEMRPVTIAVPHIPLVAGTVSLQALLDFFLSGHEAVHTLDEGNIHCTNICDRSRTARPYLQSTSFPPD